MKWLLKYKYLLFALLAGSIISGSYLYGLRVKETRREINTTTAEVIASTPTSEPIIDNHKFRCVGNSMYPTLVDGGVYTEYRLEPKIGDIVSFDSPKFLSGGKHNTGSAVKRLVEIREDGAWWVLGDNRENSHDSADFGWILPSERSNVWVVKVD